MLLKCYSFNEICIATKKIFTHTILLKQNFFCGGSNLRDSVRSEFRRSGIADKENENSGLVSLVPLQEIQLTPTWRPTVTGFHFSREEN